MAESSILWQTNGTGDGTDTGYTQTQVFEWLRSLLVPNATNLGGVSPDYQNKLAVSGTSSPVSVATGAALVYGIPYVNTATVTMAIPTPSAATRIDRVVLRANYTAQTVRITRIAGSEGGAAPSLTQSAGTTWDIPLAQVSITTAGVITVTDEREWLSLVGAGAVVEAKIGTGAVTATKIGAGAVGTTQLAANSVTRDKIPTFAVGADQIDAGAVGASELATGAVIEAKIGTGAVTETKIGAAAVTEAKLGTGAVTADKIGAAAVTSSKIGTGAVIEGSLATGAVTADKIGTGAVTEAKLGTGAVATAKIADNAVDDTKAGDRVPQFYRRKGGDATTWSTAGTTSYTPGAVRMQAGAATISTSGGVGAAAVTFPVAFSAAPLVFASLGVEMGKIITYSPTTTQITIEVELDDTGASSAHVKWLAIGPE